MRHLPGKELSREIAVWAPLLDIDEGRWQIMVMGKPVPEIDLRDEDAAELAALTAAVAAARADRRGVPHAEMRAWLLEIAAGNFDAVPPEPRSL